MELGAIEIMNRVRMKYKYSLSISGRVKYTYSLSNLGGIKLSLTLNHGHAIRPDSARPRIQTRRPSRDIKLPAFLDTIGNKPVPRNTCLHIGLQRLDVTGSLLVLYWILACEANRT